MRSKLILASRSSARADLLVRAGVEIEIQPAPVDEEALKASLRHEGASPRDLADALAEMKALRVSAKAPGRIVLGADQVLAVEDTTLDKPRDLDEARRHLQFLRGKRHQLLSAAVICENGRPLWRHVGTARLHMRPFSDGFLEDYLVRHGDSLLQTVGAYRLEEGGAPLFNRVDGDYFTVLGLPLLEVLAYLRTIGVCSQ